MICFELIMLLILLHGSKGGITLLGAFGTIVIFKPIGIIIILKINNQLKSGKPFLVFVFEIMFLF